MNFLGTVCRTLGIVWLALALGLILIGVLGIWIKEGFTGVQDLLTQFDLANWLITTITVAPGFALLLLSGRLREKGSSKS